MKGIEKTVLVQQDIENMSVEQLSILENKSIDEINKIELEIADKKLAIQSLSILISQTRRLQFIKNKNEVQNTEHRVLTRK